MFLITLYFAFLCMATIFNIFDTSWDEVSFSISEIPNDAILESLIQDANTRV